MWMLEWNTKYFWSFKAKRLLLNTIANLLCNSNNTSNTEIIYTLIGIFQYYLSYYILHLQYYLFISRLKKVFHTCIQSTVRNISIKFCVRRKLRKTAWNLRVIVCQICNNPGFVLCLWRIDSLRECHHSHFDRRVSLSRLFVLSPVTQVAMSPYAGSLVTHTHTHTLCVCRVSCDLRRQTLSTRK